MFIALLQVVGVLVDHPDEVWLGPDLIIFNFLECLLLFFEVENAVLRDDFVDLMLLIFDIIVGAAIWLEGAFHVLEDARLGVQPVLRELFPVIVLGLLALSEHFGLGAEAVRLLVVHLGHEFLFAL